MPAENNVKILADSRENPEVIAELEKFCKVEKLPLSLVDYICSHRAIIERKTEPDFAASLADGRLFEQARRLRTYQKPLLLIEKGHVEPHIRSSSIKGALISIALGFGIPVLFSETCADSADIIFRIARREQFEEKRLLPVRQKTWAPVIKKQQEFLVAGLPGVSVVLARRLLEHFKIPQKIFLASEEELQNIEGIGKEKAKRIFDLIRMPSQIA